MSEARRIAVVPAYNESPTVIGVLDRLIGEVDEIIVIDDGSTDDTRSKIRTWIDGQSAPARLIAFERNRGMSAAYDAAFTGLKQQLAAGEYRADDLVVTVDADGQHDVSVLKMLHDEIEIRGFDAVMARRDLSDYPRFKQIGNTVMSQWASWWAGSKFHDVESGYRIVRLGPLADAMTYYKGYRYSETVEVAVVLSRLGYKVSNDLVVPVPIMRSNTRLRDAVQDLCMCPVAWYRAVRRRPVRR